MDMRRETAEHQHIDISLVEGFSATFINRFDCYPFQLPKGTYKTVYQQLTLELIKQHLLGHFPTLGTYALSPSSTAKWVCFDADDAEQWEKLIQMACNLSERNCSTFLEQSSRGGHLWLFMPEIAGRMARAFAMGLLLEYDIRGKLEVFPKQDDVQESVGSLVRLPLGIHRKVGKRFHFIDRDGKPIASTIREQIALLSAPPLVSLQFIEEVAMQHMKQDIRQEKVLQPNKVDSGLPLSEQVKSAISVFDFVSRYVELDQHGRGYCPFHADEHMSFQVHATKNYWSCYAQCGDGQGLPNGGSVIDFYIRYRHRHGQDYSFKATLGELAKLLL